MHKDLVAHVLDLLLIIILCGNMNFTVQMDSDNASYLYE
jgi:hypothetical protein